MYHDLEYVGSPRSYKLLNSNSCVRIRPDASLLRCFKAHSRRQQLRAAHINGASKIWVFHVGDIKLQELPLTFALSLAWNIDNITPTTIPTFFEAYAEREFGSEYAKDISELLLGYNRLMALGRHEHIEVDTLSISSLPRGRTG